MKLKVDDDQKESPEVNLLPAQQLSPNPSTQVATTDGTREDLADGASEGLTHPLGDEQGRNLDPTK